VGGPISKANRTRNCCGK